MEQAKSTGLLSVVATPIGNLDDITLRALATLRDADVVLAEDTRRSRTLLTQHNIGTKLRSFHAHSGPDAVAQVVEQLIAGKRIALITDAGTPLVSDPGSDLVSAAAAAGVRVESIPGASAVLASLASAGLPFDTFRFAGFPPRSGGKRTDWLERIGGDEGATVFFEAPTRIADTLRDLGPHLHPARRVAVCRELTKLHEEIVRGSPDELAARFAEGARGEISVVVERGEAQASRRAPPAVPRADRIRELLAQGVSPRDAARALAVELRLPRRELYAEVLEIAGATRASTPDDD
jgi:16S rRNA (cytidine1402-2'-O)-methyltransferase